MAERFNLRVLDLPALHDVAAEVALIEPYPDRVAATAPKGRFMVVHADGIAPIAAMILKQELLALDADGVLAPSVYLGERRRPTDVLIMATLRQYRALIPRLRAFPLTELQALSEELELLLGNYHDPLPAMRIGDTTWHWGARTYVMGILNITPDSFSGDGLLGQHADQNGIDAAVAQARDFMEAGADILDVGGESTRPGAIPIDPDQERERIVPVIAALKASVPLPISVDTFKAEVAAAALDAGAEMINDVWGLRVPDGGWNEPLARLAAERGVPIVLMHNRRADASAGPLGGHYAAVTYRDLLGDIVAELRASIAYAERQGIHRDRIIVDPGIGFGKTPDQNIELLRRLAQLRSLGRPLLLGTSRKSFIGRVLDAEPGDRVEGTAATVVLGIRAGADIVRVHDVGPMVRAARMADALVRSSEAAAHP